MFRIKSFPVFKQLDQTDCGLVCLKMIIAYYGKNVSIASLKSSILIQAGGITLASLSELAEKINFKSTGVKATLNQLIKKIPLPTIAHIDQNHYVVIYKVNSKSIYISDPAVGHVKVSHAEFEKRWIHSSFGILLLLQPKANFYNSDSYSDIKSPNIFFIFKYLTPYKKYLIQLCLTLFLVLFIQLALPFLTQSLVDYGIGQRDLSFIYLIVLAQIFFILSKFATQILRDQILLQISLRVSISIISDFIDKLIKLPMSYFRSKTIGDFTQRIRDHDRIKEFLNTSAFAIFFDILSIVVLASVLFYFDFKIFVVFAIGTLIFLGWSIFFLKRKELLDNRLFEQNRKDFSILIQLINAIREIKLNNSYNRRKNEWKLLQSKLFNTEIKLLKVDQAQYNCGLLMREITSVTIIFLSALAVVNGNMTIGTMLAIQFITGSLSLPLTNIVQFIIDAQKSNLSFIRLAEIHQLTSENNLENLAVIESGTISIENVEFRYVNNVTDSILKKLNITIPKDKTTAIVGKSGSGKSTIVKLLLKLYQPQNGNIKVNGSNLNDLDTDLWRSKCGAVLQDSYLFDDTIENNITESLSQNPTDLKRLYSSLELTNLTELVDSLPYGIKTRIGNNGNFFSGGERQRLLLARALYKNPDYLFLDEATSSLDTENEFIISKNLKTFCKNKTVVLIAHRLSTIKEADQILVIENGTIKESGRHCELLRNQNTYYNLVQNQL